MKNLFSFISNLFLMIFGSKASKKTKATTSKPKTQQNPKVEKPNESPKPKVEEPVSPPEPEPEPEKPAEYELPRIKTSEVKIDRIKDGKISKYSITNGADKVEFREFRKGFYTVGTIKALDIIEKYPERLAELNLSESSIKVMQSVSDNEGNLDAINTWDNSYLTFGMFQWSLGATTNRGELPALLKKIKVKKPEIFHHYFGQFGLDLSSKTTSVYGYFLLKDQLINTVAEKNEFRTAGWGYRFWLAGQNPDVQAIQIEHAMGRLKTFYWKVPKGWKHKMSEIVTSEYGVALILDNHVNRPGYVDNCLMNAWKQTGLGQDPSQWTNADEMKLINAYLKIRETFGKSPMTDAAIRAGRTKRYLDNGTISSERHSFNYEERIGERGILDPFPQEAIIPTGYDASEHESIRHYDEESGEDEATE